MPERQFDNPPDPDRILFERAEKINTFFASYPVKGAPERLREAMLYSLKAGGKRIRPALCIAWTIMAGGSLDMALPFAAGFEMIHTYSLIHDDLPAMDDDDYRRGRPSSHKAFDEATAILAGDALLTDAFYVTLETPCQPSLLVQAVRELALAAGSRGMAGGQMLDMVYTGSGESSRTALTEMQAMKTGALLRAACVCGAIIGDGGASLRERASIYGEALGRAFQIRDDILDETGDPEKLGKPVKSDAEKGKLTWPAVAGLEASCAEVERQTQIAIDAVKDLPCPEKFFLMGLASRMAVRGS